MKAPEVRICQSVDWGMEEEQGSQGKRERREGRDEVNREEMEEKRGRKLVGGAIGDADKASVGNTTGGTMSQFLFNSISRGVNSARCAVVGPGGIVSARMEIGPGNWGVGGGL